MAESVPGDWLYDSNANKFNNTYFRDYNNTGFAVDMSGNLVVRGEANMDNLIVYKFSENSNRIRHINGTQPAIFMSADGVGLNAESSTVSLRVGMEEKFVVTSNGVGIGTSNPESPLHIAGLNGDNANLLLKGRFPSIDFKYDDGGILHNFAMFLNNHKEFYIKSGSHNKSIIRNDAGLLINDFTGQHRAFVENISHTDVSFNEGLIVCADKNIYISVSNKVCKGNGAIMQNESLPMVSLCKKLRDKSCFGVISNAEDPESRSERIASAIFPIEKEDGDTRIYINSVGEGAVWVSNKNGPLESGDYITTSDIPGYGEKQDSEFLANYTVAKITMDCDFNPQLQPKEIILKEAAVDDSGNTVYNNVLDANGEIQWTPKLDSDGNVVQEYPYNLRYLDLQGAILTKAEYDTKLANSEEVYIAAYVGCTYHCG